MFIPRTGEQWIRGVGPYRRLVLCRHYLNPITSSVHLMDQTPRPPLPFPLPLPLGADQGKAAPSPSRLIPKRYSSETNTAAEVDPPLPLLPEPLTLLKLDKRAARFQRVSIKSYAHGLPNVWPPSSKRRPTSRGNDSRTEGNCDKYHNPVHRTSACGPNFPHVDVRVGGTRLSTMSSGRTVAQTFVQPSGHEPLT
jgi:hypothetical protein